MCGSAPHPVQQEGNQHQQQFQPTPLLFLLQFPGMGENGNESCDLWPPLARKDGSFGRYRLVRQPFPWASIATPSQTPKTTGASEKRIKLGVEPKGERKAAIDREIAGQRWPPIHRPPNHKAAAQIGSRSPGAPLQKNAPPNA
jgi:hypothetical protein|uniref:Uncharacterized protein n=1 Tax=Zea mays TaxID=4577 RepID=C4J3Y4_MAIZE|nr:unknown [Zea mays]